MPSVSRRQSNAIFSKNKPKDDAAITARMNSNMNLLGSRLIKISHCSWKYFSECGVGYTHFQSFCQAKTILKQ